MFGGLEIKDKKKEESSTASTAPAATSSAFSFLNSFGTQPPAAPAPDPAPSPPSSAFSFLNVNSVPEDAPADPQVQPSTMTAFSFLAAPTRDETEDVAPAPVLEAPPTSSSSFSFLQTTTEVAEVNVPETNATSSAFQFMSSDMTVSTISRDSPAPMEDSDLLATNTIASVPFSTHPPTGSGVTFGGAAAAAASGKPKKRRARTSMIGTSAQTTPAVSSLPPKIPATTIEPSVSHEEANAAAQRAEDFLNQKLREQQRAEAAAAAVPPPEPREPTVNASFKFVNEQQVHASSTSQSQDEDDIVAAARAAAEEAQHLVNPKRSLSERMGFSGLFRGNNRASPPISAISTGSGHRPPAPIREDSESSIDRLRREQEEVQRAMAERKAYIPKAIDVDNDYDDQPLDPVKPPIAVIPVPKPGEIRSTSTPTTVSTKPLSFSPPAPVRTVPVAPPAKTTTEKLEDILKDFRNKVIRSMEELKRLRQHKNGLLEERFVTVAKERLASQQRAAAEAQQLAAAEAEDFELADRMQTMLDAHERDRLECASILENISRALTQLESQKEAVVKAITACFTEVQAKLKEFKAEQDSKDTEEAAEALKRFSVVSRQLSAENERLQQDLRHLERDAELVAEERKELERAISEQAGVFEQQRDEAKLRLHEVEDEIEELRKQLAAKQAVAAELRTEVAGHEESILKVRVKFSRQLTRLEKKEATIKDNQEEWELEKNSYERSKEEHDAKVKAHSEALLSREQLLDTLSREIEMADTFESIVAKEIGFEVSRDRSGEGVDDDLAQVQAEVVKTAAAAGEAKEFLQAATSCVLDLEAEIKVLEVRLPQLEEMKKAAASRRDFKAAGKASKEIKEAISRLKDCQEVLLPEAQERQTAAELDLKTKESQLAVKRKVANEMERESAVATMQQLADNIRRLVATKKSVCSDAKEYSIQGVGAFVLDGQINVLRSEGETYGEKYGGWGELMSDFETETPSSADASPEPLKEEDKRIDKEDATESAKTLHHEEDSGSKIVAMDKFRALTMRLKEVEETLEAAVADEDFEKADMMDEMLQALLAEVQALNLTDEEMEAALAGESAEKVGETESLSQTPEADPAVDNLPDNENGTALDELEGPSSPERARTGSNCSENEVNYGSDDDDKNGRPELGDCAADDIANDNQNSANQEENETSEEKQEIQSPQTIP